MQTNCKARRPLQPQYSPCSWTTPDIQHSVDEQRAMCSLRCSWRSDGVIVSAFSQRREREHQKHWPWYAPKKTGLTSPRQTARRPNRPLARGPTTAEGDESGTVWVCGSRSVQTTYRISTEAAAKTTSSVQCTRERKKDAQRRNWTSRDVKQRSRCNSRACSSSSSSRLQQLVMHSVSNADWVLTPIREPDIHCDRRSKTHGKIRQQHQYL